jgi:hypothetical protein
LPVIIGASVCAEIVGKNDGSPRTMLGILLISGTLAQPKERRRNPRSSFLVFISRLTASQYELTFKPFDESQGERTKGNNHSW